MWHTLGGRASKKGAPVDAAPGGAADKGRKPVPAMGRAQEWIAARWEGVSQLVMALGEELTLDGLDGHTLDQVLAALEADAVALHVLEATGASLELLAQRGLPPELAQELSRLPRHGHSL